MEEKRKYLEYFDGAFNSTVADKIQPENWPYVAYSKTEGVVYTIIPKEPASAYQMVDLGLPSGLKWADRNVGASSPEDAGLYFSWGNVDGHAVDEEGNVVDYSFDSDTYASTQGSQYTVSTLDAEHDAATVNMGSDWRMPTIEEYKELVNSVKTSAEDNENPLTCTYIYLDKQGNRTEHIVYRENTEDYFNISLPGCNWVLGVRFTNASTGASVYFPACGIVYGSVLAGIGFYGGYWSSSVNDTAIARYFYFDPYRVGANSSISRCYGLCVRGVHA